MISTFIDSISTIQLSVLLFLITYLLLYGVRYHLLSIYAVFSGRGLTNDVLGRTLNLCGYAAMLTCLYWWG